MDNKEPIFKKAYTFDSPIEFVFIGPINGRLRVLAKSTNAGIDLIGFYQKPSSTYSGTILRSFRNFNPGLRPIKIESKGYGQPLLAENSYPIYDYHDERKSSYAFIWRGEYDKDLVDELHEELNKRVPDILSAIEEKDEGRLEWSLSVLLAICNQGIWETKRSRQLFSMVLIIYLVIIVGVIFYFILKHYGFDK